MAEAKQQRKKQEDTFPDFSKAPSSTRIVRVFKDTDLRNSHEGLYQLAKQARIDLHNLALGEMVIFVNTAKTSFKAFASGNKFMIYYKDFEHKHRALDERLFKYIPKHVSGGTVQMDAAVREFIQKEFHKKK